MHHCKTLRLSASARDLLLASYCQGRMSSMDLGDADRNLLCDPLSYGGILQGSVLLAIGDEADLQKRRRAFIVVEHVITGELYSPTV